MTDAYGSPDSIIDGVELLLQIERIKQLKARYCRFVDTKQWGALRALFTPDARFEGLGSAPSGADLDKFIDGISTRFVEVTSIHHCHMPEIKFTTPSLARGVWAMMDYVDFPIGVEVKEVPGHRGFFGYGHYEEEYERVGATWFISFLRLTRIRFDAVPVASPLPIAGMFKVSTNWLS